MLVSSGELDPDALELLCALVERRIETGDHIVVLSGLLPDPHTIHRRAFSRQAAVVEVHALLRRHRGTLGLP